MFFFSIAAHLEIVPTQMQIISLKMELEVRITVMVTNLIFYETGQVPFKKLIFTGGRRDNFGLNPVEGGESEPEDISVFFKNEKNINFGFRIDFFGSK